MDATDGHRSLLSLPSALLTQMPGLEFVFFTWGASHAAAPPQAVLSKAFERRFAG